MGKPARERKVPSFPLILVQRATLVRTARITVPDLGAVLVTDFSHTAFVLDTDESNLSAPTPLLPVCGWIYRLV